MSEIPYYFDNPAPRYFKDKGWFKNPKARAFICWCFERCSSAERDITHDGQRITLKPYQFIFGRKVCSEETGLTEDEVRAQQISMEKATFLKKAPNKTPNRFTIYEWSTDVFFKINPQQNPQLTPNKPPTNPHNLEEDLSSSQTSCSEDKSSKEEKKREKEKEAAPLLLCFGSHVRLKKEAYEKFIEDWGEKVVKELIEVVNDYCVSKPKTYACYAGALRTFHRNQKNKAAMGGKQNENVKSTVRAQQLAEYTAHNGSFNDKIKQF